MALCVREQDVWKKYTVKTTDGVIEIREQRMLEILAAGLVVIFVPCGLALMFYSQYGYFGVVQFLICMFALWIAIYACITSITLPREVRFFPHKAVIEQSSVLGVLRWRKRLVDISAHGIQVINVEYQSNVVLPESTSDAKPFTWRKHFSELLEMLFAFKSLRYLLRPEKETIQAFGLFTNANQDGLLIVMEQRTDLDQFVHEWLSSHNRAKP